MMRHWMLFGLLGALAWTSGAQAAVPKDLAYPPGSPSAEEIANQVYFVNHFYAVKNFFIHREGKNNITVLATRALDDRASTNTLRRFLNNAYDEGEIKARDMVLFHSGKLRGTGMLITEYVDDNKDQLYAVWLPALEKIRRFAEPPHDDSWGGTDFTFGDIYLRKPRHETHELLGEATFEDCLGAMALSDREMKDRYLAQLDAPQCGHKGKAVFKLKSTTKFPNWWYDYRISYVDSKTFADYRTEYFKNGEMIKVIDRDWASLGLEDPRAQFFRYWYGKTLATGNETMISVPEAVIEWNKDEDNNFWSEETLEHMRD